MERVEGVLVEGVVVEDVVVEGAVAAAKVLLRYAGRVAKQGNKAAMRILDLIFIM